MYNYGNCYRALIYYNLQQDESELLSEEEYLIFVNEMKNMDWKTNRPRYRELLNETRPNRRAWILSAGPDVDEVDEKFPIFRRSFVVSIIQLY